jgi:CubicO group peptidase (beta-lactamase class C family)
MKETAKSILIASLLVILSASLVPAQAEDSRIAARVVEELKVKIPEWIKESAMPGAAIAIVDDTSILWQTVFGQTSREGGVPITSETLFSIQSMSKSFTALGVLMAVQDGVLDLDTPIIKYIPDFTVNSPFEDHPERKMTLRLLLSHKAGFTHEAPLGSNYDDRPHVFDEHVLSISDSWLRYPVGYRFSYSNLGIDLAGYILQEMVGMPFWGYIQQRVLDPMGMKQSTMDIHKVMQSKNRAIGHVSLKARVEGGIPVFIPMIPAGGVYTNILDMAKYMQFHINKGRVDGRHLLESKLIDQMHAVSLPEDHQRAGYGLCLNRGLVSRTYYLQHGGGGYGFATSMVMYPEIKLGVVTMCNSRETRVNGGRIMEVINRIVEEELGNTEPHPAQPTVDMVQPVSLTDERIERLKGIYDQNIVIGQKDEEFGITLGRDFYPLKFNLDHGGDLVGVFGKYSELRVKPPIWGHNGSLVHLNRYSGSCRYYDFHGPEKSKDRPGPDKPEWKRYLGRYRMLAWGRMQSSLLSIRVKDGYLSCNNMRCIEFEPGLFFTFNGEALDFRGTIPTYRNIMLIKSMD